LTQDLSTKRLKGKQKCHDNFQLTKVLGLYGGRWEWTDTGLAGRTHARAREQRRSSLPSRPRRVSHGQRRTPPTSPPPQPVFNFRATPVGRWVGEVLGSPVLVALQNLDFHGVVGGWVRAACRSVTTRVATETEASKESGS